MSKHTPGPWIAGKFSSVVGWPVVASGGRLICDMVFPRYAPAHLSDAQVADFKAEVEANARLIAAAPDLLAALQEIGAMKTDGPGLGFRLKTATRIARAAILKATGADHG